MKKNIFSVIPLVFFILILVSCSGPMSYYKQEDYSQAVSSAGNQKKLSKEDYYALAMSYYKLGDNKEAKKNILIYMLMATEQDERNLASQLFVDMKFDDYSNILLLKPQDSVKSAIVLYKSYSKLSMQEQALEVLNDYLIKTLSLSDFVSLIINFPCDDSYNCSIIKSWYNVLKEDEYDKFIEIVLSYSKTDLFSESSAREILTICSELTSSFEGTKLAKIYYIVGNCCIKLSDKKSAYQYWKAAYKLDPDNQDLKDIFKHE